MGERKYSDFDLLIEGSDGEGYRARVIDSPAGEAVASFDFPFSELELENFMLKVGRPRGSTRRLESSEVEAARAFGTRLYDAVFRDDLRLTLTRSLDEVQRRDEGLRIRLRFSDAPELSELPWEFLFSEADDEFLILSAWTPIVRYLDLTKHIEPLTVTGPLRILAMVSSPHDYPTLDVEGEWNRIESALQPLLESGSVVIDRTDDATLLTLQRTLRKNEYHIFHFVGHGGFDEKADDGVLVLEDGTNKSRLVAGRDVGTILHDHRSLRLAVLNACEGARAGGADPFSGAAQSLVRKGVPAVVAMQFEITDDAAIVFAQEFYGAIADALPVDAAVGEARRAMFGQGNDIEWGTPVAYLRGDGQLFDVLAPPPAPVAEEAEPVAPVVTAAAAAEVVEEQPPEEPESEAEPVAPVVAAPGVEVEEEEEETAEEPESEPEPVAPVVAATAGVEVVEEETAEEPEPVVPIPLVPFWRRRPVLFSSAAAFILIVGVGVGIIANPSSTTVATEFTLAPTTEITPTTRAVPTTRAPTTTVARTITSAPFALPDADQIYDQPVEDAVRLLTAVGLIVHEATIGCSNSTEPGDVRRVTVGTNRRNGIIFGKVTDDFDPAALADVGPGDEVTVWTPTSKPC